MIKLFKNIVYGSFLILFVACNAQKEDSGDVLQTGAEDREYCIKLMQKIVDPVLIAVGEQKLNEVLPRKDWETSNKRCDIRTTNIQAVGRTLSGLSPWLSLGTDNTKEGKLRAKYIDLSLSALINITDPTSTDYLFDKDSETYERIVHNAYLAYPLLIATKQLWEPLTTQQKNNVINALKSHRKYKPFENNWLLFASVIEAAIWKLTGECDMEKLEYGINKHMEWYVGDGIYGDGHQFHWDYYNSYVIHPLLLEILKVCKEKNHPLKELFPVELGRAKRYAEIQEHLISPEGTFPVIGRSGVYRIAAFQLLGYVAYRNELPSILAPGSTRAALMAVTKRMMEVSGTFDENGWLNAGVVGKQLNARDVYTVTGALYMCTMGLTHLGLPANDPFWTQPSGKWFQQKVWDGDDIPKQHEYYGK
ncbi:DUF2264 domain-containing protein [Flavivirga rizhaonensis]|uniref:DUF2264 domain-containing protein n=1 Tax=Flavivirga rizhaonensis TaxID=2559571 RepID=A0A4S1E217_9FLAO|nr:DUF2264 domain-containing protein [Flavivirga rizhaonensis]TGV04610.1 DUF2264 domain-containing protein [Flavivirga rizhaonensis]